MTPCSSRRTNSKHSQRSTASRRSSSFACTEASRASCARPTTAGARIAHAPNTNATASDSDRDGSDRDDEQPVAAGPPVARGDITPQMAVAVPFRTRKHGETHFEGRVVRVMANKVRVRFPDVDGTSTMYDVDFNRLFEVSRPSPA